MPGAEGETLCTLPPKVQRLAREQLNEDPSRREEDIKAVKEWLLKQPHLNARTDRRMILRYLRGCKFSLERTKGKMEMYYTCKGALPDMFKGRDPKDPTLRSIIKLGLMFPLPGYDKEGRKVIWGRLGAWDPSLHRPEDLFKAAGMMFDVMFLEDEQHSVTGIVQANDMTGLSFKHVAVLPPALIKRVSYTWQQGYPFRPKAVHYVHTPQAFDALFSLLKPLFREKMKKRIHMHGDKLGDLQKHIPREMLPAEYGGFAGTIQDIADEWLAKMDKHRPWFLEDEAYTADESRRPGKPKTQVDIFGTEGSFRKLDFD